MGESQPVRSTRFLVLLVAGIAALLIASSTAVMLAELSLRDVVHLQVRVVTEFEAMTQLAHEMENAVLAMLADANGYVVTGSAAYLTGFRKDAAGFDRAATAIRPFMDEPRELAIFERGLRNESHVRATLSRQIALRRSGASPARTLALITWEDRHLRRALRISLIELADLAERELGADVTRLGEAQTSMVRRLAALAIGGLGVGVLLSLWWARRLSELYAELAHLGQFREDVVAIASHDLRSPLATIHGVAQLLASGSLGTLTEEGRRLTGSVKDEAERGMRLIENYLNLTRLQEGRLILRKVPLDLGNMVRTHLDRVRPQFEEKRVRLEWGSADLALVIKGDPDRLTQVLDNLLTNALKFSPIGGVVRVGVDRLDGTVRVAISDQGPGMAPAEIERIFDRFSQGASGRRTTGGLGLGLAIAREIVARHGGRIWAESAGTGTGSRFIFELPIPPAP